MIVQAHQNISELKEDNSGENWLSEIDEKVITTQSTKYKVQSTKYKVSN